MESPNNDDLIQQALREARETRALWVGAGLRHEAGRFVEQQFGRVPVVIVADRKTFAAAGKDVADSLDRRGFEHGEPFLFSNPKLHAEYGYLEELLAALSQRGAAIPLAVGSGTINDLVKRAAHLLGRPYMAIATAASMDGYTAYGASIIRDGLKRTVECPAPAAVLADLEVIAAAPPGLNASGYADLAAKITAGADWIIADALGIEPIDPPAWSMVQDHLRQWLGNPAGIRMGDRESIRRLTTGLMLGGFAMQRTRTSRVASGADHQFSHLWDMQHHTHEGRVPSHGFKVGIGTLASLALYEQLLARPLDRLDIDALCVQWTDSAAIEAEARATFETPELIECALREMTAKHVDAAGLREQLTQLQHGWPKLRERLATQLPSFARLQQMLREAGCPAEPEEIGISRERLIVSYRQAGMIRRRLTVLDLARRTGLFEECLEQLAGPNGHWAVSSTTGPQVD